jgi:2-C-methyl-D-erythritol 4-phosphate cytidylyltransferase
VLRRALSAGGDGTDCASFVEAAGGRVKIVEGDRRLVKITTKDDLDLVESVLR